MEDTSRVETQTEPDLVLPGKLDYYNGVTVDTKYLPSDADRFSASLAKSLQTWRQEGRRGIWLRIPIELSHCIPIAVQNGFTFHSAERSSVLMTHWLPTNEMCLLPDGASHTVGIGGFVYNAEKREVLVVREKYNPSGMPPPYKLPGGYVKAGEALGDAAEREVEEETGVKSQFQGLLTFRHMHPHIFTNSDLYFVALLKPVTFEASRQEEEIEEVLWMPIDEYRTHPNVNSLNQRVANLVVDSQEKDSPLFSLETVELSDWMRTKTFHDLYTIRHN